MNTSRLVATFLTWGPQLAINLAEVLGTSVQSQVIFSYGGDAHGPLQLMLHEQRPRRPTTLVGFI